MPAKLIFADGKRCVGVTFQQRGQTVQAGAHSGGRPVRRVVQLPACSSSLGCGSGAVTCNRYGCQSCITCPASAPTCRDHYDLRVSHRVRNSISIDKLARGIRLAREVVRFAVEGRGALTFGVTTAQVFCRSTPEKASPEPAASVHARREYDPSGVGKLEARGRNNQVAVCPVGPEALAAPPSRAAPIRSKSQSSPPN